MTHILFYGIAPTVGDTAIGQSILARLNAKCQLPLQIFTTHPETFSKLPEAAGATVHGLLPAVPVPSLRSPLFPLRLTRLIADLRATGGLRTLSPESHATLRDALEGCAAVVFQGGPNWNDRWMGTAKALERWLFVEAAHHYGAKVFHVGVSCGPFDWSWPRGVWLRPIARAALSRHDLLIVRDSYSTGALERLGVRTNVVSSTDAAVFLEPRANDKEFRDVESLIKSESERPRVAVCVRDLQPRYGYDEQSKSRLWSDIARVLDQIQRDHATVFFLGTDYAEQESKLSDLTVAKRVKSMMKTSGAVVIETEVWDASALKQFYGLFDVMLSMRLHPSILALGQGTPSLVVSYDRKCEDFLAQIGKPEWALPFTGFDPEATISKVAEILRTPDSRQTTQSAMATLAARHADDWDAMFTAINDRAAAATLRSASKAWFPHGT